jgi:general secretion pathway protein K
VRGERGAVLIALLWILVALSIIALSFSRESLVEVAAARNARDLTGAYYVARAGIAATAYRLWERRNRPQVTGLEQQVLPPDPLDLGILEGNFGGGSFRVEVQDDSGKLNLNFMPEEQLRGLLEALAIPKPDADVIVDSVMDWRDPDRTHRMNGAEDEFYQALSPPYKARNGRIETVEELLLVRGVTREYYYGYRERTLDGAPGYRFGLSRYTTAYTNSNRINVNFADLAVLMALPGMDPRSAELVYQRRRAKPFRTVQEITTELAVKLEPAAMPYVGVESSGIYSITAAGRMADTKVLRTIRAVITLDPKEPSQYRVLYWNENPANL